MIILRTKQFAKGVRQFKKLRKLQGEFEMNKQIIDECKKKLSDKTITNPEEIEKLKNKLKEAEIGFEATANKTFRENMVLDMRADKKNMYDDVYLEMIKDKYGSKMEKIIHPNNSKTKREYLKDRALEELYKSVNTKMSPKSEALLKKRARQEVSGKNKILRTRNQVSDYVKNISDEEINNLIETGDITSREFLEGYLKDCLSSPRYAQTITHSGLKPKNDAILLPKGTNAASEAHEIIGHGTRLTNGDEFLNPARNTNYLHPNFHIRTEQAANDNVRKFVKELNLPEEDFCKLNESLTAQETHTKLAQYANEIYRWRK